MNILRYAFRNTFRNAFLSLSSILIIGLLAFFVNILLFVLFSTETFIENINNRISLTVNFKEKIYDTHPKIRTLMRGITSTFTGITFEYISPEKAFSILAEQHPDLAELVEGGDENPLPASLRLRNIPLDTYANLDTYVASFQDVLEYNPEKLRRQIITYREQYDRVKNIIHNLRLLELGVYVLLGLFAFTVFVVVHMIITNCIYYFREEIEIIELVGGKSSFIYGPFMIQSFFYTLIAGILAFCTMFFCIHFLGETMNSQELQGILIEFSHFFFSIGGWIIATLILLGLLSSFFATFHSVHSTIPKE